MTCTRPLYARYDPDRDSKPIFYPSANDILTKPEIVIPCGKCQGCIRDKASMWATRCYHESQMHDQNGFINLTYEDSKLPPGMNLSKNHWQLFMKKYRNYLDGKKIRYFMCGEYGTTTFRPHYHACIFGHDFEDKEYLTTTENGDVLYTSAKLDELWGHGQTTIGELSYGSASYVAGYTSEKVSGKNHARAIKHRVPEFRLMSRAEGLGKKWYEKFKSDIYPHDYCIVGLNGDKRPVPSYYDSLLKEEDPELYEEIKAKRVERAEAQALTHRHLHAKEVIANAKRHLYNKRDKI